MLCTSGHLKEMPPKMQISITLAPGNCEKIKACRGGAGAVESRRSPRLCDKIVLQIPWLRLFLQPGGIIPIDRE